MVLCSCRHNFSQRGFQMNYYQILGIKERATPEEIKKAYNNMIKAFYPDYYRGSNKEFAEEKTKELNEAYEVLKDPNSKAEYDYYLKTHSYRGPYYTENKAEEAIKERMHLMFNRAKSVAKKFTWH